MNAYHLIRDKGLKVAKEITLNHEVPYMQIDHYRFSAVELIQAIKDQELVENSYWANIPDYITEDCPLMITRDYYEAITRIKTQLKASTNAVGISSMQA